MKGFDYETYKKEKIEKAIQKKMEENIFIKTDKILVNKNYYEIDSLKEKMGNEDRFNKMFEDEDFKIDEEEKKKLKR